MAVSRVRVVAGGAALLLLLVVGWLLVADPLAPAAGPAAGDPESAPHTHSADGASVSLLVGDGTRAEEAGYRLVDVRVPRAAGEPGTVSFRVQRYDGSTVRSYLTDHTRKLHLYVVRTDLAVFRHLHPTMSADGTWTAPVTLPEPGAYRVVAEFVARDDGGDGDFLMLGTQRTVPGSWEPEPVPDGRRGRDGEDGTVAVAARGTVAVSRNGRLEIEVSDASGRPVELGTYLGTSAHVTGFQTETGTAVHMHPLGEPRVEQDATRLTFHTEFTEAGDYRLFVQVRVDGMLHTVPVTVTVREPAPGS
jgi:hypothetical protein